MLQVAYAGSYWAYQITCEATCQLASCQITGIEAFAVIGTGQARLNVESRFYKKPAETVTVVDGFTDDGSTDIGTTGGIYATLAY